MSTKFHPDSSAGASWCEGSGLAHSALKMSRCIIREPRACCSISLARSLRWRVSRPVHTVHRNSNLFFLVCRSWNWSDWIFRTSLQIFHWTDAKTATRTSCHVSWPPALIPALCFKGRGIATAAHSVSLVPSQTRVQSGFQGYCGDFLCLTNASILFSGGRFHYTAFT